jgi:starch synthase (maltosyl-transferring)
LPCWEDAIARVKSRCPEASFLAEAGTRPKGMHRLAKIGFTQSYTYFTWRNTKEELAAYLHEVAHVTAHLMRPSFWPTPHDILTPYIQAGGVTAFAIRAVLAATGSPAYGIYSGYELVENVARPGAEEPIDNEKYEYKPRDWEGAEARGDSLAPYLRLLNRIRREHPALRQLRNLTVHWSDDDAVLVYVKHLPGALSDTGADDTIIVVANLDPHSVRETTVHLDTSVWGAAPGSRFPVTDLNTGQRWEWGEHNYVRLDAFTEPVHVLHVVGSA